MIISDTRANHNPHYQFLNQILVLNPGVSVVESPDSPKNNAKRKHFVHLVISCCLGSSLNSSFLPTSHVISRSRNQPSIIGHDNMVIM